MDLEEEARQRVFKQIGIPMPLAERKERLKEIIRNRDTDDTDFFFEEYGLIWKHSFAMGWTPEEFAEWVSAVHKEVKEES